LEELEGDGGKEVKFVPTGLSPLHTLSNSAQQSKRQELVNRGITGANQ